ncbi:hypothetical protein [Litchfieldia alkalitelluris]|uniref:hypothetical protein n=1 Tax=Litchfieldia alkalitelluris TaxID=304268 RepID=UPI0009980CB2|nr:hypothetical protein [Litchfieldia alkalitelluris]
MKPYNDTTPFDAELKGLGQKLRISDQEQRDVLMNLNKKLDESHGLQPKKKFRITPYYFSLAAAAVVIFMLILPSMLQQGENQSADLQATVTEIISSSPIGDISYKGEDNQAQLEQMQAALNVETAEMVSKDEVEGIFQRDIIVNYSDESEEKYKVIINSVQEGDTYVYTGYFQEFGDEETFYKLDAETAELMFGMFAN